MSWLVWSWVEGGREREAADMVRPTRLAAALAAAWEAEVLAQRAMTELAEFVEDRRSRSRLLVLSAVCQAHASRLLGRLASLGVGPLPVPPEDLNLPDLLSDALRKEGLRARNSALRYAQVAESCRQANDPAAAWVCELNRAEEEDRSAELLAMAEQVRSGTLINTPDAEARTGI